MRSLFISIHLVDGTHQDSFLLVAFVGKATLPSPVAHPSIFCKLFIPCKNVRLHCAWCHCSHLCCHPCWVLSVLNPECFPYLLVFEIWVAFICLQPEIHVKLISHALFTTWHKWYHNNKESRTDLLHLHISFTYLLQQIDTSPPLQRTWKEFLPSLDQGMIPTTNREQQDWHQLELWLHWHMNSSRSDVQLPSLVYGPINAKDPQRTPATISLCGL